MKVLIACEESQEVCKAHEGKATREATDRKKSEARPFPELQKQWPNNGGDT